MGQYPGGRAMVISISTEGCQSAFWEGNEEVCLEHRVRCGPEAFLGM